MYQACNPAIFSGMTSGFVSPADSVGAGEMLSCKRMHCKAEYDQVEVT